ncbi:MAG: hypothetical protein NTV30_08345, partial [Chloroflexi bacterium]|nr:hypothetical protein [Chloroflexota bacterium]
MRKGSAVTVEPFLLFQQSTLDFLTLMTVYYIVQLTVVLATIESIQFLAKVQLGGKMITVKDKVIIITGAGQGIGRAFANTLAE